MPTILFIYGWRLFFYSNELNEPIHIHVQKGEIQAKFWLLLDEIEIEEAFPIILHQQQRGKSKKSYINILI